MTKLELCPKCGGLPEEGEERCGGKRFAWIRPWVRCPKCGPKIAGMDVKGRWNKYARDKAKAKQEKQTG